MIRKQIYMTKKEIDTIKVLAKKVNVSDSEYIRRLLDSQLSTTYFISYMFKESGNMQAVWHFAEVISEVHPIEWLAKVRSSNKEPGSPPVSIEYHIVFWSQVSKIDASKL